ncbi:MAG: helix-hairpin-helix domain-containing protein [Chthoniobacteraceae bacterium]
MNTTTLIPNSPRLAGRTHARLGFSHGYRFDRDDVYLNAMFQVLDASAHRQNWALQLWACPQAPQSMADLSGHCLAEAPLPPIGEIADEWEGFEVRAFARPPAGIEEHVLALALVSGQNGRFDEIHDLAIYARPERLFQPQMLGGVGYWINNDQVEIAVERIHNPRNVENLSGTLSLELWALPQAYQGGDFQGESLAGVAFDPLAGQYAHWNRSFSLPFTAPSTGNWTITLMLREWTASGFVTRDFTNFATPYTVTAPKPAATPAPQAVEAAAEAPAKKTVKLPAAPAKKEKATAKDTTVSINTASLEELTRVKGLSLKNAEAIIAGRPYRSLNDLLKVKGFGAKLLTKVKDLLKV